ncbi:MAG: entericidin A/B family lipoprotein [Phycisphaerales bacterium]|nr:entericidin A/B family lipoprotein [Phycisphaerales bacterium]
MNIEHEPSDLLKASRILRAALVAIAAAAGAAALSGCNTTEGAGKDIEALGESIQDAAD